ncbi:MAG: alkaline phosphatase family protein [Planctomycetota bacterium]|nr:alkaline phosphatase family protein [Planctomycetota bacterium]
MRTANRLAVLAAPLLLAATSTHAEPAAPGVTHVLVIGIDGLSPEGIEISDTPHMRQLIRAGSWTINARAVLPTSSGANWASMITGATPPQHGVTSNEWAHDARTIEPADVGPEGIFPTIFGRVKAAHPDARIAAIYEWGGFSPLCEKKPLTLDRHCSSPEQVADTALAWFAEGAPTLTFLHLDHVDITGHEQGWSSAPYIQAVERADAIIGRLISGLRTHNLLESTAIIVTSDHGGIGNGHGGESMAELEIPWIISGPGIAQGRRILAPVNTEDTAATVAMLLGSTLTPAATGRPVKAALASYQGPDVVASPLVQRPKLGLPPGLHTTGTITIPLSTRDADVEIRYTTDGTPVTHQSPLYAAPVSLSKNGTLRARAYAKGGESAEAIGTYRVIAPDAPGGVRFERCAFPATLGELRSIPDFSRLTPAETGVVPEIMLTEVLRRPVVAAARFRGQITIPESGTWTFGVSSDDGVRVSVRGQVVCEDEGRHGPRLRSGKTTLAAGTYDIVVEWFNGGGGAALDVYWAGPGVPFQIIPTAALTPPKD